MTGFLKNLRDLSSVPLSTGSIRPGLLFRSDDVCTVDRKQARNLINQGIRHVIDLRGHDELGATGRGPLSQHTQHHHLPLIINQTSASYSDVQRKPSPFSPEDVGRWYFQVAQDSMGLLLRGIGTLASVSAGVVFHCAAGKDRTGIFAAAVLATLGAKDDDIVADYQLTQPSLPAVFDRLRAAPYGFPLESFTQAGALMDAHPESMSTFLRLAREQFGGLDQMLFVHGLSDNVLKAFLSRYVRSD